MGFVKTLIILLLSSAGIAQAQEVIVIKLRTPYNNSDYRFDPYYELEGTGCFGITGCHQSNVMRPDRIHQYLLGRRAAFVQQGYDPQSQISQQRLVFLTPIIEEANIAIIGEDPETQVAILRWDSERFRALKFVSAPVLVGNDGKGLPAVVALSRGTLRDTLVGGFGSLFRKSVNPVDEESGRQMIKAWDKALAAGGDIFAVSYTETLNPPPKAVDFHREQSLLRYYRRAVGRTNISCKQALEKIALP